MDWQTPAVGLIVMAATVYVVRSAFRLYVTKEPRCGSGCGKCGSSAETTAGRIALPRAD